MQGSVALSTTYCSHCPQFKGALECRRFSSLESLPTAGLETCSWTGVCLPTGSWRGNLSQSVFHSARKRLAENALDARMCQRLNPFSWRRFAYGKPSSGAEDGEYGPSVEIPLVDYGLPSTDSADVAERTSIPSLVQGSPSKLFGFTERVGALITAVHFLLVAGALVFVDFHILRTISQPMGPFFLTAPFLLSAAVTAIVGYCFVPILKHFKAAQIFRIEGPTSHFAKTGTPTMGGLFFIPVGLVITGLFTGFNSVEVQGVMMVTLAFFAVGLTDDGLAFWRQHNYGLPGWIKFALQVAVGIILFLWLESANLSHPYKMKNMVWFPAPLGPMHLGKWYLPLTAFCCAAMSNGVNLTDGLDGLASGTAAAAFLAMSVALSSTFPALGVFGSSMAGSCFGFLVHNRHKAKVFMGDTGSLALGGALAAMACCSGMFLPLFIASGVFVLETLSVIGQVFYFKLTKQLYGKGRRWLRMAPFHHHLELSDVKEPVIITMAYTGSIVLAFMAACLVYIGS